MFTIECRRLRLQLCLIIASTLSAVPAGAGPLSLDDAVRDALERDESLARLEALADARAERAVADGALPDPELVMGYRNLPADGFSTTENMMTMLMVGLRQSFPAGRSRHLSRDRGELEAQALRAEHDDRVLAIRRAVRRAWLDWRDAHERTALARDAVAEFERLVDVTERRYAAGTARQLDVSQARLELAALGERIIGFEAHRDAAAAELARWLGVPVEARHVPGDAPDWPTPDPARLRESLPGHPALRAPEIRIESGRVGTEIARQTYKPKWMAEVSYGFRAGDDPVVGGGKSDLVSGMVSVSVPLFTGNRQDRRLASAMRERDAARSDHADRMRVLAGSLERQLALWQRFDELVALYRERLLPEAGDTSATTLSAYRSDRATFDELIRARVAELDYGLRGLRVTRQRDDARIELLYLAGE